jgi:hypothetical protein
MHQFLFCWLPGLRVKPTVPTGSAEHYLVGFDLTPPLVSTDFQRAASHIAQMMEAVQTFETLVN